jgi:hypothetical protein
MTYGPDKSRARIAKLLGLAAIATTTLAVGSVWWQGRVSGAATQTGKVLPGFTADMPQVRVITIATSRETFTIVRQGNQWVMPERDNYPVADAALSDFAKAMSGLSYKDLRTSDPNQFAKLSVDDPKAGGAGTLITVKGATGQILASLHVAQIGQALFVRKAGTNDVFEAAGAMPNVMSAARWLDLKVLEIMPESIASVTGKLRGEAGYSIVRRPDGGFAPVDGTPNVTATTSAIALTKWMPLDVKPASALTGDPIATHITNLRDGLVISVTAYNESGRYFAAVSADATTSETALEAQKINQRSDNWAFELDGTQFADLTFSKDAIANEPSSDQP